MIKQATFDFLKELKANNHRDWFQGHKDEHDTARENVLDLVSEVIRGLSAIDPAVPANLLPKSCVMRIYRDVRFSKDKTPYKNNFGAGISANGKNFNGPGYYLHLSPGGSFVAGGCWMPGADHLKAIRQEIDYNSSEFRNILEQPSFKKFYGEPDQEERLKTVPKGYNADHPEIQYLKLKSFTFTHDLTDPELLKPGAAKKIIQGFAELHPFIVFLRNAIGDKH